ncbi:MAG: hypothetical protein K0R24_285 [Gammaproteobacteria bacterium]|jgi:hypothetical protein|nr:hypothetical protein [Gammaproteobacteria bacterium]MCE3237304.1 hypothetical protein [Gammaproteobacteria bacterium]
MRHKRNGHLFSLTSILSHIILIAIIIGTYYYLSTHHLFPMWIDYIYSGGKIVIAVLIILASARSALMPVITLTLGLLILFTIQDYTIPLISSVDAWQLIVMSVIGLFITILVKW